MQQLLRCFLGKDFVMSSDWRKWFTSTILQRGEDYFLKGRVRPLKKTVGGYQAQVVGTYVYTVRLVMDGNEIVDSSCNCPYAVDGSPCKHQAAALFQYEADNEKLIDAPAFPLISSLSKVGAIPIHMEVANPLLIPNKTILITKRVLVTL